MAGKIAPPERRHYRGPIVSAGWRKRRDDVRTGIVGDLLHALKVMAQKR
jgi:hypothetical protein